MTTKSGKIVYLQVFNTIISAAGSIEIRTVPSAQAEAVYNQVGLALLSWYLLPCKVLADHGI